MAFKKTYFFRAIDQNGQEYKRLIAKPKKKKAFGRRVRTLSAKKSSKYYLKVPYGHFVDVWGQRSPFYNDGWYSNKKDLLFAFRCFDELKKEDF